MDKNNKKNISGAQFTQPKEEFAVRSATSSVGFNFEDVPPILGTYIGLDDQLLVSLADTLSNQLITLNLRILRPDGIIVPMQFNIPRLGNRAFLTQRFQLVEGFLLSATATLSATMVAPQWAYITASIQRAPFGVANQYETLLAGYLNSTVGLSYPQGTYQRPADGAGVIVSLSQGAPAAGADLVITVPARARWRFISFQATLTTAAAVANRNVSITFDDGVNVFAESPSNFVQAASIVNTYNAFDSGQYENVPFDLVTLQPLPSNIFLAPGFRISTETAGIQAADQWSAAQFLAMEWLENL
jgi:hypothetical protein